MPKKLGSRIFTKLIGLSDFKYMWNKYNYVEVWKLCTIFRFKGGGGGQDGGE